MPALPVRIVVAAAAVALLLPSLAAAGYGTTFTFNNGTVTEAMNCSEDDWALVKTTMEKAVHKPANRNLAQQQGHRGLKLTCSNCGLFCAFVGGGCTKIAKRRRLGSNGETTSQPVLHRTLGACDQDITDIDAALVALAPTLAPTCRALIEAPDRKVECVETTDNCFVEQFDLWDARLNYLMVPNLPPIGTTFCMRKRVTFRAQTNFYIGKMFFVIRGSNGYFANKTEWAAPYFFKGDDGPDVHGSLFPPGNYTLTATAEDNPLHTKTISFRSRACL